MENRKLKRNWKEKEWVIGLRVNNVHECGRIQVKNCIFSTVRDGINPVSKHNLLSLYSNFCPLVSTCTLPHPTQPNPPSLFATQFWTNIYFLFFKWLYYKNIFQKYKIYKFIGGRSSNSREIVYMKLCTFESNIFIFEKKKEKPCE